MKRRRKKRRKNVAAFESAKDRERRLSDERARKKREAQQRGNRRRHKAAKRRLCRVPGKPGLTSCPPKKRSRRRGSARGNPESGLALFKKLHWDNLPDRLQKFYTADAPRPGQSLAVLGEVTLIRYDAAKGGREKYDWGHHFDRGMFLLVNDKGELSLGWTNREKHAHVTEAGIVG